MKVAILGATGMLGSMVHRYLSQQPGYELTCPSRLEMPAENNFPRFFFEFLSGKDYVINCIGVIKSRIIESNPASVRDAIQVNAMFPHHLVHAAEWAKCKVIQIATDCVYSGFEGPYNELSQHDPTDVYGKTKSLGEVRSPNVNHLRCSIIGPEQKGHLSLLDWLLNQPQGAKVCGYTNHLWNGVTTLAFAKLCHGIMSKQLELSHVQHVVPLNVATKAELLSHFNYFYHRNDIQIEYVVAPVAIDRTLSTLDAKKNQELWQAAGYDEPPYIQQMIEELANYQ